MRFLRYEEVNEVWDASSEHRMLVYREVWERKPLLQKIYRQWYERIFAYLREGTTIEIGGGTGNFKTLCPRCISLDIVPNQWLDLVGDGMQLPFRDTSIDNIVCIDLLPHLKQPITFMAEVARVLKPGGRFIAVEGYLSTFSHLVLKFFFHVDVDRGYKVGDISHKKKGKPLEGNMAIPTTLFFSQLDRLQQMVAQLRCIHTHIHDFFIYPLSGGFNYRNLVPVSCFKPLMALEKNLHFLGPFLGFKMTVVMEKIAEETTGL